ncbi:hypothetical protein MTsPCn5_05130 [Croceitalea sp. MTPC5]|uniref:mucoidy inhibitor MuiA family protein n=1 Tax=Croceitalea sp. MTPC5 TaxID=3056565 RepID=UPI002B391694|nr:hypothetical protein MTsPCn5_05130 [Croceitalea sp. MTPC5]
MKNLIVFVFLIPGLLLANDLKIPSEIKKVTVYLSGAEITRTATCLLKEGSNEVVFTGLSHKIDESSIQVSGLNAVSILSIAYDINYLSVQKNSPEIERLQDKIEAYEMELSRYRNIISGLEEEEKVIKENRTVNSRLKGIDLEKIIQVSTYYRERITTIKNEVFEAHLKINKLNEKIRAIQKQMAEFNNTPEKAQGELTLKVDVPVAIKLSLTLKYLVNDAGWIPNYDIKSNMMNTPLNLAYKAHVYQKTGQDWNNIKLMLSTGNPEFNITKPNLGPKYLNFTNQHKTKPISIKKKSKYLYNPMVKQIIGMVTDASGAALPGASVKIKGTSKTTRTDFDGSFKLNSEKGQELIISYIGFMTKELPIYSSVMNIRLEEDTSTLDEVVVIAQGIRSEKRSLGYSVSSIGSEKVLRGKTPGIDLKKKSNIQKVLRPLYIIDGIPSAHFEEGDLDENEIQSKKIVVGEEASAIYGTRGSNGVVVITTKKSTSNEGATKTEFAIKKSYSIPSDNDITAIEINTFRLPATYEYFAAPIINENVFLTASFSNWEQHQLLPGEANIYFEGTYAGKTVLDPYTTKKEMILSLGIDPNITVTREQERNFKSKSFTGSNRILDRTYNLEVKNNKGIAIDLKLLDRIPKSQQKEIKVTDIVTNTADYDVKKGLLTWKMELQPQETKTESFSFQVKYPRGRYISL